MTKVFADFMLRYKGLKEDESWQDILLEIEALEDGSVALESNEYLRIYGVATRCCFYGGNYDKAEFYARKSAQIIENHESEIDLNLHAESLYLYSAINRARADKLKNKQEDYSAEYGNAEASIKEALSLASKLNEFVAAKVYFNAGALYHDVANDLPSSKEFYAKAADIFKSFANQDDYNRTMLRLIRVDMEEGRLPEAELAARELNESIGDGCKTKVHALQLMGKIAMQGGKLLPASQFFEEARELADTKGMSGDSARLTTLINFAREGLSAKQITSSDVDPTMPVNTREQLRDNQNAAADHVENKGFLAQVGNVQQEAAKRI